ncbi:MAG: amidohydrolase family protein [Firmicutes bacterium]|nr:amidohydrolase family protein [Bacillota bacterium]
MIIDFHTHTFPDKIAAAAISKMSQAAHCRAYTTGTVNELKASMQDAGIDYSVILPVATNPLKVSPINDLSIEMTGRDGLIYFGCIHPDAPNWHKELGRIAAAGMKGIKIHPVYQATDIDDIRFLRILARAGELGLLVVMHAGDDIGFPGVVHCSPAMIRNALHQVGDIKLIAAHMGGWRNWQQTAELLADTKVFLDTSFSLASFEALDDGYYDESATKLLPAEDFCRMVRLFGSERIVFGTDSPWSEQKKSRDQLLCLPLSIEDQENIMYKNAKGLLGI